MRRLLKMRASGEGSTPAGRHAGFVARLRRAQTALQIRAVPRTLRHARLYAPSFYTAFTLHAELRRAVLASGSPLRVPARRMPCIERILSQRAHYTRDRIETRIVERLASGFIGRTVSATPPPRAATVRSSARRDATGRAFPRLAMALSRPAPVLPALGRAAATIGPTAVETAAAGTLFGRTTVAMAPLPAHELSRVTEHVLRTLDHRVLSYRERNGQV